MTNIELINELKAKSEADLVAIGDGLADAIIAEWTEPAQDSLATALDNIGISVVAICDRKKSPH